MNKVILTGRITATPFLSETADGNDVCTFIIEVDRENGGLKTDFIRCIAFSQNAQMLREHYKSYNRVMLEGSMRTEPYTKSDGSIVNLAHVRVDKFEFINKRFSPEEHDETAEPYYYCGDFFDTKLF